MKNKISLTIPVVLASIACLAWFVYNLQNSAETVYTLASGIGFACLLCIAALSMFVDKFMYTGKLSDIGVDVQGRAVDLGTWQYHREKSGYIIDAYTAQEPLDIVHMPININGIPVIFVPPTVVLRDYLPTEFKEFAEYDTTAGDVSTPVDISSVVKEGASPSLEIAAAP